ncbi:hypothetical protein BH10PSE7_BH10PSE7_04540 [soil metagenome]
MRLRLLGLAAALALLPATAAAGEIADAGAKAEALAAQGKYLDALDTLSSASDAIWQKSPLVFRKALFVAADPAGYGMFDLRENAIFKQGEPLLVYAEPVGFGYGKDGALSTINLSLDFEIKNKDGKVLGSQKEFSNASLRSRVQNREFMLKVVYTLNGAPAGDYEVTTTVNDKVSGKSGSFTLPFTIVP